MPLRSEFHSLAYIWPTTPRLRRRQVLLGGRDYALRIDEGGMLPVSVGGSTLAAGRPLLERHWHLVAASFDGDTGETWVGQRPLLRYAPPGDTTAAAAALLEARPGAGGGFRIAAGFDESGAVTALYNGKIDGPAVAARALSPAERDALIRQAKVPDMDRHLVAAWDFSREIPAPTWPAVPMRTTFPSSCAHREACASRAGAATAVGQLLGLWQYSPGSRMPRRRERSRCLHHRRCDFALFARASRIRLFAV